MPPEPAGRGDELPLRVSVATLDRVIFPHPQDGAPQLALERKASLEKDGRTRVWAQPFGGGVRILDARPLQALTGPLRFDSPRSQAEQDLRILIAPPDWEAVKRFCIRCLQDPENAVLEASPQRELHEEFAETLGLRLRPGQYTYRPAGFVVEDGPVPTDNVYARGLLTARLYHIFEVRLLDRELGAALLAAGQGTTDPALARLAREDARRGGRGRANAVLTLSLSRVRQAYAALPPAGRYRGITLAGHALDQSVLAILDGVDAPQYRRL
ncbi:MAG: hypothetical protein GYA17_21450 [Chloroflexi bacterium]|jgi:hypothetical protein|nr:hypothetical protein [Anaerolineaceae bacterium]NMB90937.1 hypothetical protein [Chloroflexota bacterium]